TIGRRKASRSSAARPSPPTAAVTTASRFSRSTDLGRHTGIGSAISQLASSSARSTSGSMVPNIACLLRPVPLLQESTRGVSKYVHARFASRTNQRSAPLGDSSALPVCEPAHHAVLNVSKNYARFILNVFKKRVRRRRVGHGARSGPGAGGVHWGNR